MHRKEEPFVFRGSRRQTDEESGWTVATRVSFPAQSWTHVVGHQRVFDLLAWTTASTGC